MAVVDLETALNAELADETVAGLGQMTRLRTAVIIAIGIWLGVTLAWPGVLFYIGILMLLLLSGLLHHGAAERAPHRDWPSYLFITIDVVLIATAITLPNPWDAPPWPPQYVLRLGHFPYFYLLLAATMLCYRPMQMVWTGAAVGIAWIVVVALIVQMPGSRTWRDIPDWFALTAQERYEIALDPRFVDVVPPFRDILLLLAVSVLMASVVWRMRRLAMRQAVAARERANLSRYFSPNLVTELASIDAPLAEDRALNAAVLFVDIRGYTEMASHQSAADTMSVVRGFHRRMTQVAFAHDGTIDKFIGDAMMAIFGVPRPGARDAADAIACGRAMLAAAADWNAERAAAGLMPLRIGVGVHHGPVVAGDIGGEGRFEYTVIGDTVNVAHLLEHQTRDLEVDMVVSAAAMAAAQAEIGPDDPLFAGLKPVAPVRPQRHPSSFAVWVVETPVPQAPMILTEPAVQV